jgi:hypothetical protein
MKTNLIKIEVYITNFDGNVKPEKQEWEDLFEERLNSISLTNTVHISDFKSKELEWNDEIDINKIDATNEQYKKYFEDEIENMNPEDLPDWERGRGGDCTSCLT